MAESTAFARFKELCVAQGLIQDGSSPGSDDVRSGIDDDGTLMYEFIFLVLHFDLERKLTHL
jgi:hypothetical protein